MLRAAFIAGLAVLTLAGCAVDKRAPYGEIAARAYVDDGPPSLTIYTVQRVTDGSGAHSALLVNGSQRLMFDPAGSFEFPTVPERGDVLYGITPRVLSVYIDYHARETYTVLEQKFLVSPEVAELALQRAQEHGAAPPGSCTTSVARVLRGLPGFEGIRPTLFPRQLANQIAKMPGVQSRRITDDDADENHGVLLQARNIFAEEGLLSQSD